MLTQLRIQNFKGWKDTGLIRLAPITLFFGANSSGKSSIGQFLMLLKQTVESQDRKAVLFPGGRNSGVQLGSFQEMVFGRDITNRIAFEYEWALPLALTVTDPLNSRLYSGDYIRFNATVGQSDQSQNSIVVDSFQYELIGKDAANVRIGMERRPEKKAAYSVTFDGYDLKRNPGRVWHPATTVRFYGFPDEVVAYYQNADFVQSLNLAQEQLFRSLAYLGPLRSRAERLYSWTGTEPESVGYTGDNTVAAILAARKRMIGMKLSIPDEELNCVEACVLAIESVVRNGGLVLDEGDEIFDEYRVNLSLSGRPGQGDVFMKWVHDNRWAFPSQDRVPITKLGDSYQEFPSRKGLETFDVSDRKFVAVANTHGENPPILEATDSKWWGWKEALADAGITVQFLCDGWIKQKYKEKMRE